MNLLEQIGHLKCEAEEEIEAIVERLYRETGCHVSEIDIREKTYIGRDGPESGHYIVSICLSSIHLNVNLGN